MDAINQIQAQGNVMWVAPAPSKALSETHAALVTSSTAFTNDVNYRGTTRTVKQLRQNNAPNAWEVSWLIWNFTNNTSFYYVVLKPGGWELGKADPAYPGAQRFLATGTNVKFPVGSWNTFEIVHDQAAGAMRVKVNGALLVSFTDTERPYTSGKVGFYAEDAEVELDGVAGNINDNFDGYPTQSFSDGKYLGAWTVNFLGYGGGGIRSLGTAPASAPAATPPAASTTPLSTASPFSRNNRRRN
ncbi:MAG: Hemolysin-type calcium-binding region [Polaromonas sp.]|jgi:hypothetical protein|nr:Hemolysin-type calcium-binding region [Polaromonas sp.]